MLKDEGMFVGGEMFTDASGEVSIDHFTVVGLVTWLLNGSEAGVDLVTDLAAFIVQIKLFLC